MFRRTHEQEAARRALIQEVKDRHRLSDIIGRKTKLKKAGAEMVGLCFVHQEKTPSLSVNDAKGVYSCFGCSAKDRRGLRRVRHGRASARHRPPQRGRRQRRIRVEARCDQVSRSLFGITERDTRLERSDRHTYDAPEGLAAHLFDTDDLASYDAAFDAWGDWEDRLSAAADIGSEGGLVLIGNMLLDLTGKSGGPVKCFRLFARQCMVAGHQLDPRAKFTPDASPTPQNAAAWGSALEAEAARFKRRGE